VRARAQLVAVADGAGGTRLDRLYGEAPLLLRRTGPERVHLVGGAAGPLGGDDLLITVDVGAGATVRLHTVAASIALPGATGAPSRTAVHARVAAGGRLEWLPEPLIAAHRCDHIVVSTVELEPGAALVWREELVCGRQGEESGSAAMRTAVRLGGRPLCAQHVAVGPGAPGWDGPAVLGTARASGSLLVVDPAWAGCGPPPPAVLGETAVAMPLTGPAVLVTATGADALSLRRALDSALHSLHSAHAGLYARRC
jgi:urease accessory protein